MVNSYYIKFKYYDGSINTVDEGTKKAVKSAVKQATEKIRPDFFKGLSFHVASDFSNLDEHNAFSSHLKEKEDSYSNARGITDYSAKREIYIQESAVWSNKLLNLFTKFSFSADDEIKHATMHELGHQFDSYYGTSSDYKKQYEEILSKYPNAYSDEEIQVTPQEGEFLKKYYDNNGYSDKSDFKEAVYKDLQKLDAESLNLDEFYFVAEFYNRGLDIVPTREDIEKGDYSRSEMFAQLFSYIMGTDDGKKDEFIKRFPHTYKVVSKYISIHSK